MIFYLLAPFAVYRLAYMAVFESGPLGLAERLRTFVFERTDASSRWQEGISCIKCVSWWVAWVVAGLLRPSNVLEFVLLSQSLAGVAIVIHYVIKYLEMIPMVRTMAEIMKE